MPTNTDQLHLDAAISRVTGMLSAKRDIWTHAAPLFENFDIQESFFIDPVQFGLAMCNLKMNRLKKRYQHHIEGNVFARDPDAEDTLIDLASYAILTLALVYREKDRLNGETQSPSEAIQAYTDAYIYTPEAKAEIAALAAEMMGYEHITEGTDCPCGPTVLKVPATVMQFGTLLNPPLNTEDSHARSSC